MMKMRSRKRGRKKRPLGRIALGVIAAALVTAGAVWLITSPRGGLGPIVNLNFAARANKVQGQVEELPWVTRALLPVNQYSRPGDKLTRVNAVVIHYVGNPGTTAEQNRSYFARLAESGETYASSNFVIGLQGEILECVPVNEVAYCSNWRNHDTLSIECCHPDDTGKFTDATYDSLVKLTAWLCDAFGLQSGDVIRHYDITGKICPKYFVDHPDAWKRFLADVMDAVKAR